ncbi:MAG TPA: alpha/beta hydrolase [Solirubrobacteraceae bacterium]|nr:alpha/beta hydrolase [Solirubrobacteraceae bacterium]
MTEVTSLPATGNYRGDDGVLLAYHVLGHGRALILLHGYLVSAHPTWVQSGVAARLADAGHRVLMPELRGHGESNPHNLYAYPRDALARDVFALVRHLDLQDYDLGGYGLGGQAVTRALALGLRPRRAVIAGAGLESVRHATVRRERERRLLANLGSYAPDTPEGAFEARLAALGADPMALLRLLDTLLDTSEEDLAAIRVPTLLIAGADDTECGSVEDLAALLPESTLRRVPGDHRSVPESAEFAEAVAAFL